MIELVDNPAKVPFIMVYNYACNISGFLFENTFINTWTLRKRLAWLAEFEKLIIRQREEICATVAKDKGVSPENVLMNEYTPVRLLIRYYRKNAERILQVHDRSAPLSANFGSKVVKVTQDEPYGVIGVISPFNYPFALPLGPVISALVTGNGVILKPSPETNNTNVLIMRLLKESLARFKAADLFWILPAGIEYGEALVAHNQVKKIHFTGSVAGGRAVAEANAKVRFVPPTLELGGSNAGIVLEDADIEEAASVAAWSRFCGLSCNSIKRWFVVKERYDEFKVLLTKKVGAISSHETFEKLPEREKENYKRFLMEYTSRHTSAIAVGRQKDSVCAPLVCFLEKYDPELGMFREETFCPILPVVRVENPSTGIRYANASRFGLGASIFTKDRQKFLELAGQLDCGTVCQNDGLTEFAQPQVPFGGRKDSGHGFTHGPEGLLDFVQKKTVIAEKDDFITSVVKKLGMWKMQLYPWTPEKLAFLRRWIERIINHS